MKILVWLFNIIRVSILAVFTFLLILHFIIKDSVNDLIYVFYATPKPILLIFNIFLVILFIKPKRMRFVLSGSAAILFLIWIISDFRFRLHSPDVKSDITVLYWNAARGKTNTFQFIAKKIESIEPDIIGLVEAENLNKDFFTEYEVAPYNYTFRKIGNDMLIGVKGSINDLHNFDSDHFYKYGKIEATIHNESYSLFIVDIFANQPYFRKRILDDLYKAIDFEKNVIVLGDFNTPYESLHFKPFKENLWNAERKAGSGLVTSWPDKFPLLQIDHIWSSKNILPVYSYNEASDFSDHSIIISAFNKN